CQSDRDYYCRCDVVMRAFLCDQHEPDVVCLCARWWYARLYIDQANSSKMAHSSELDSDHLRTGDADAALGWGLLPRHGYPRDHALLGLWNSDFPQSAK